MLEKELAFYEQNLENWLHQHADKFVLVKGEEMNGVYDTNEQALTAAASLFGLESYFIRRIEKAPEQIRLPAFTLGLFCANPSHAASSVRTVA